MSIEERMTKVFEFIADPNNAAMSIRQSAKKLGMPESTFQRIRQAIYRRECGCSPVNEADSDNSTKGATEMSTAAELRSKRGIIVNGKDRVNSRLPIQFDEHWLDFTKSDAHLMTFSPAMAERILMERNAVNRPFIPANLEKIIKDLKAGRWQVNGETIIFNTDGNINNGQHRLKACWQTGIPITTWVVFGVPPENFHSVDIGRTRTGADILSIDKNKNAHVLSSVLALLWLHDSGRIRHINETPPKTEFLDILDKHPEAAIATSLASGQFRTNLIPPRIIGFCFYQFRLRDEDAAAAFFRDFKEGANLEKGDPVLVLNRALSEAKGSRIRMSPQVVLALIIMAWNSRYAGRKLRSPNSLKWTPGELFPEILPRLGE